VRYCLTFRRRPAGSQPWLSAPLGGMEILYPGSARGNGPAQATIVIQPSDEMRKAVPLACVVGALRWIQLAAVFLRGSSAPQSSCQVIGVGIRLAQDVGAHRRKVYGRGPSAIRELWKRAFWYVHACPVECFSLTLVFRRCLVFHDRFSSAIMGRACAIQDEEYVLGSCAHYYAHLSQL
jgi:hypothetical protein